MGNEGLLAIFIFPVSLGILALLYLALFSEQQTKARSGTLGLGRRRIAAGFLGAIFAVLVLTTIAEFSDAYSRGMPQNAFNWSFSSFIIATPFVITAIIILGFPLYSWLRRFRLESLFGCFLVALFLSITFAALFLFFPHNLWCESNPIQCVARRFSSVFVLAASCAVGFGIFARLPLFRTNNQ
jgi:hypothetical protein